VRLVDDAELSELEYDPDRALSEYEAHQAKYSTPDT